MIHHLAFGPEYNPALLHYHRLEMDQGRLVVWTDVKIPFNQHKAIEDVLKSHRIFSRVIHDEESNKYGIDVPLKRSDPDKLLKKTIRILKENQWIDSTTHDEITKVWKAVQNTHYFRACTEGVAPPLEKHARHWQPGNFEFRPILNAFQNVILYDLAREECSKSRNEDSAIRPFHRCLMEVAGTQDFFHTPENQALQKGLLGERSKWQNLLIPGPDGLNPIDLMLCSRNGGLSRLILYTATSLIVDKRIDRAILNAILRFIEKKAQLYQSTENPWSEVSALSDLKKNLAKEKQKEFDVYVGSLVNAAVEVYAFLSTVLYPGGGDEDENPSNWIGTPIEPEGVDINGKKTPDFFETFEDVFDLNNTVNALILDRILKWVANVQPGIDASSVSNVFEIYTNLPSYFILGEARSIVSEQMNDAFKKSYRKTIEKNNPTVQTLNQLLGDEFTTKHGSKWLYDSRGAYCLDDYFIDLSEKSWFVARFKKARLENYLLMPFPGFGYQLLILEPVQIGETHAKEAHPTVLNSASASSTSSCSSSSTSHPSTSHPAQFTPEQKIRLARSYFEKMKGFLKENQYDKAMSSLDSLIALNSADKNLVKDLYQLAHEKYRKLRFQEVIDIYERLFKIANSNLEPSILDQAHFECGAAYHALNQLEDASRHYGIIIGNLNADNKIKAEALMNRAAIFTEQGNLVEALKDTEEAVKAGEAAELDSDVLELWKEQLDNLRSAAAHSTARPKATSSMITD